MLQKNVDDLIHIAAAGGGLALEAGTFGTEDIVRVAAAAAGTGARIIVRGASARPTDQLVRIASAGRGAVLFD